MTPYNRQLQLKQYAAQAANAREAAGLQALGSGLGNAAAVEMANMGSKSTKPPQDFTAQNQATLNQFNATRGTLDTNLLPKTFSPRANRTPWLGMSSGNIYDYNPTNQ